MTGQAGTATRTGPRLRGVAIAPLVSALNHLLDRAAWARSRLQQHAGKSARIDLPLFSICLAVSTSGEVTDAADTTTPEVAFALTPPLALRLLARDGAAWQQVAVTGDTAFARDLLYVAQNLRWDAEEDLSRVFGDIAAHRMVGAAASFIEWQRNTAANLMRNTVAYWTDEQPLLAARSDIERYLRDVDAMQDDVSRLEKRVERLLKPTQA